MFAAPQVMAAAVTEDHTAEFNGELIYRGSTSPFGLGSLSGVEVYAAEVELKQIIDYWQTPGNITIGGTTHVPGAGDTDHWKGVPGKNGTCIISYNPTDGTVFQWSGGTASVIKQTHINTISAQQFLTQEKLKEIVGEDYKHSIINSNEPYYTGSGGTRKFLDFAAANGFDLKNDYGAVTWQIYVKAGANETNPTKILQNPAIYWSTIELTDDMIKENPADNVYVPVMGYRNGKYDVYSAQVVINNPGKLDEYLSLRSNFANIINGEDGLGGNASIQFDTYEEAETAYKKLLDAYEKNGTVKHSDLVSNGL